MKEKACMAFMCHKRRIMGVTKRKHGLSSSKDASSAKFLNAENAVRIRTTNKNP
jgi:hypothetical protein